jgi:thioredoxin reductase (NADPH)
VYLTKYGSHVHLIVRGDKLRASAAMADRVLANPAITVHWSRQVADAIGGGDWLEGILLRDSLTGATEELAVKGLFYAIGHTPNTRLVRGQLNLDERGYLRTLPGRPETSVEGVYAAGDVADAEWRQGITAAGSGCQAALAAERWLSHHGLAVTTSREEVEPKEVGEPKRTAESTEANYDPDALWQKGSYALRKLYHDSTKPLLVVYTSPTCGPCHVLKPQLKRVLEDLGGRAQGVEIDIEADQEIAVQAGVSGTPTVQLFFDKELKQQWRGVKQRSEFREAIEALIGIHA